MRQQYTQEEIEQAMRDLRENQERAQQQRAEQMKEQIDTHRKVEQMRRFAQIVQDAIDNETHPKYVIIAALDQLGGFAKNNAIPWHYPADFKWFKQRTEGHICIMGRATYQEINAKLQNETSVLPKRKCFVVSSTLTHLPNATVVKALSEVENHLDENDHEKTRYIIGGERLFREGLAIVNELCLTLINKDYKCDRHFPTKYVLDYFEKDRMYKSKQEPDLRFVYFRRKANGQDTTTVTA